MLNLLPKNQKKQIIREYRIRFFVCALSMLLAAELISLVLLVPPFLTAEMRMYLLNGQSVGLKVKSATAEAVQLSDMIKQTNGYLAILTASSTPTGANVVIDDVVALKDPGIKLTNFHYNGKGQQQLVVSGKAVNRQSLLDFVKRLKVKPGFVVSDVPVSDFAKSQDIDFSVAVNVQKI